MNKGLHQSILVKISMIKVSSFSRPTAADHLAWQRIFKLEARCVLVVHTVIQTVQRHGVCNAAYGIGHYKEPLTFIRDIVAWDETEYLNNIYPFVTRLGKYPANTKHMSSTLVQHCTNVIQKFCVSWVSIGIGHINGELTFVFIDIKGLALL